ncbi:hypothetical protein LZ554_003735 [Drepanopeziza brunnea f. sp. 'monogermtubi']|nr:hypothetical protein LZ554_003735 [Drepanopeziza brunnea f. sp. 'monogermtubi']
MWIAPQSSSKLSWNYSMDRYTLTGSPSTAREPLIDSDFAAVAPSVYLSSKYHLPSAIIICSRVRSGGIRDCTIHLLQPRYLASRREICMCGAWHRGGRNSQER